MISIRKFILPMVIAIIFMGLSTMLVNAETRTISNNSGTANDTFFITGEQTLVINGFDLTPLNAPLPLTITNVSIQVDTPVAGAGATVVVYQDANGGSPVDATLLTQAPVSITQAGVFTHTFATPVSVSSPVVWVGFYLPVNFEFVADQSGSSVLTYWGWTPNGTFDLSQLSTASVLGPANGTAPVNLNMQGIARITMEINTTGVIPTGVAGTPGAAGTPGFVTTIVSPSSSENLSVLRVYPPACDTLFWDSADVGITYNGSIAVRCTAIWPGYAPGAPSGYQRRHLYYDLTFYDNQGEVLAQPLSVPVTHCITANPEDIDRAVIGLASGSPRKFTILTTLRTGNLICAEVSQSGGLSYFVPG
jgi:hypothetical protein